MLTTTRNKLSLQSSTAAVFLGLGIFLGGCKSDNFPELAVVQGTVSYKGKLLTHGEVVFTPKDATLGPQAVGEIQADGSFQMATLGRPGAALGKRTVTVHSRKPLTPKQAKSLVVPESLIPLKYGQAETTPFHFQVSRGTNQCKLEMD